MKKCPNCKNLYTDDTLLYCLADGTVLEASDTSEQTLQLPNPLTIDTPPPTPTAEINYPPKSVETAEFLPAAHKKGVSPGWVYATLGLLFLLIGGGILALLLSGNFTNREPADQPAPTPQSSSGTMQENTSGQTPSKTVAPTQRPTASTSYRVVGVAANDVLYIRPAPGNLKSSLGKIPPNATGLVITGAGVKSGKSLWYPINYNGQTGWVNGGFIKKE